MYLLKNFFCKLFPSEGNFRVGLIIAGAQKSGTSSLFSFLNAHTECCGSYPKETHFFDTDKFEKGLGFYHSFFDKKEKTKLFFEASPSYMYYKKVPKLLYEYNSRLKLIFTLREPVSRAYSAWNMYRQLHASRWILGRGADFYRPTENFKAFLDPEKPFPAFEECIEQELEFIEKQHYYLNDEEPSVVRRGLYAPLLVRFFNYFPKDQVLVINSKDLKESRHQTLKTISEFAEISFSGFETTELENKHIRKYQDSISTQASQILKNFYAPYNKKLFKLIGEEWDW